MADAPLWPHAIEARVEWRDIDGAGHMNNAVHLSLMESARLSAFLLANGKPNDRPIDFHRDVDMILARATCDYVSPAFINEVLRVEVRPLRVGTTSFTLGYTITEKTTGRLVARGESVQVTFDYAKNAKKPLDPALRKRLEAGLAPA